MKDRKKVLWNPSTNLTLKYIVKIFWSNISTRKTANWRNYFRYWREAKRKIKLMCRSAKTLLISTIWAHIVEILCSKSTIHSFLKMKSQNKTHLKMTRLKLQNSNNQIYWFFLPNPFPIKSWVWARKKRMVLPRLVNYKQICQVLSKRKLWVSGEARSLEMKTRLIFLHLITQLIKSSTQMTDPFVRRRGNSWK